MTEKGSYLKAQIIEKLPAFNMDKFQRSELLIIQNQKTLKNLFLSQTPKGLTEINFKYKSIVVISKTFANDFLLKDYRIKKIDEKNYSCLIMLQMGYATVPTSLNIAFVLEKLPAKTNFKLTIKK